MYQIVDGIFHLVDVGEYRSFGVRSPSGCCIDDITVDFQALREFVNALNCYRASEIHFMDMVLDFIG